jgi:hypothetical protein
MEPLFGFPLGVAVVFRPKATVCHVGLWHSSGSERCSIPHQLLRDASRSAALNAQPEPAPQRWKTFAA